MTLKNLKRATLIAIKKPRIKPKQELAADEFRYTVNITGELNNPLEYRELRPGNGTVIGATVNWGDGTTGGTIINGILAHTYAAPGVYQISVRGSSDDLSILRYTTQPGYSMVSMDSVFPDTMQTGRGQAVTVDYTFCYQSNLVEIPGGLFDSSREVKRFDSNFFGCSRLIMIPGDLFQKCSAVEVFYKVFEKCTALRELPEELFFGNPNLRAVQMVFRDCTGLKSIPGGLFSRNANLESVLNCFRNDTGLAELPEDLFSENPALVSFDGCFAGCAGLTSIPAGLFAHNLNATNFNDCFEGCTGLTSIPEDLFANNVPDQNYGLRMCFYGCTGLTSIPSGLFANVPDGTNLSQMFEGCTGVVGDVPPLWETHPNSNHYGCFSGCVNAANYADIPSDWK